LDQFIESTDVAALYLYLMESICRFDSCCDLHQNGLAGHSLYYIVDNIAFVSTAVACRLEPAVVLV
jgi:hypothetical protein